jgi:hypothetical protein
MGYREVPVASDVCLGCKQTVEEGTALCPACGSPIDVVQFAELELKLKPHLRQTRTALGVATGLFGLCLLVLMAVQASGPVLAMTTLGTLVFGGCFLSSASRPLAASTIALAFFASLQIAVIAEGRAWLLFQGFLVVTLKAVLAVALATGVRAGLRMRDIRRQTRPRDRKIAAAVVAATVLVGIAIGAWQSREEARAYATDTTTGYAD